MHKTLITEFATVWWHGTETRCEITKTIILGELLEIEILNIFDSVTGQDIKKLVEQDSMDEYESLIWQLED